jgi:ABC-2 type transport system permease protein
MEKILIILKREYTSRVFKKSFLLLTILTPLGIGLVMFLAAYLGVKGAESNKKVLINDETKMVEIDSLNIEKDTLKPSGISFTSSQKPVDQLKKTYIDEGYDILIHLTQGDTSSSKMIANYYSKDKLSAMQIDRLESKIGKVIKNYKLNNSGLDKSILDKINIDLDLENAMLKETDANVKGDKSSKYASGIATGLSYLMGFLMYMIIFIFGSMVMRSVMEEKINRVVEVIISSVKPFELMLGKIVGVGLVGLTQLLVWLILFPIVGILVTKFFGTDQAAVAGQSAEVMSKLQDSNEVLQFLAEIKTLNWLKIIPIFVFFFFGGYFIYSTLFAAVGAASNDDMQDSQQLMIPIMIPIILAFAMIGSVISNPNGGLAIFGSLFPLTSPILMPARLPFDPPMYQVILSMVILILSIVGLTWIAGRIYRVGILLYGKKVGFAELWKWIKMSE